MVRNDEIKHLFLFFSMSLIENVGTVRYFSLPLLLFDKLTIFL